MHMVYCTVWRVLIDIAITFSSTVPLSRSSVGSAGIRADAFMRATRDTVEEER